MTRITVADVTLRKGKTM